MSGAQVSKKRSAKTPVPKYDLNHFAVITVVFNPIKYKSRYELYHKFDEHMTRSGVILLTVECIFDVDEHLGLPKQKFEITRSKDPRHLQVKAPSVLWLKENLINIAVKRLPLYVEYVAWLDADIEFDRLDWPHLAIDQLQRYPIIQLFQLSFFLGPSGKKQILRRDYSFIYSIQHGKTIDPHRTSECYVHPGYAWAMRRETFDTIGGLLDFSILGSGDIHFAYALLNRIDETIPSGIHNDYRHVAKLWGDQLAQIAGNGTNVGYLPVNIWHHWHGHRRDRKYNERWSLLEQYQFSPLIDLEKNDKLGLLRFTDHYRLGQQDSIKRIELLEKNIITYFRSRDEDNIKKPLPTINTTIMTTKPIINTTILPTSASSHEDFRSINDLSFHQHTTWIEDSNSSIDSINSSFWNYPLRYQSHKNKEPVY